MLKYYYYNGRFGVVDIFHKNIWMNIYDETIAHAIRETFSSKAGLIIYDLDIFENYVDSPPTVDTDCCLDWKIGIEHDETIANISLCHSNATKTQVKNTSTVLINSKTATLLSPERQAELQNQMILYARILELTQLHVSSDADTIKDNSINLTFDLEQEKKKLEIYQSLNKIFATEIQIDIIENSLEDFCDQIATTHPLLASKILNIIGGLYA